MVRAQMFFRATFARESLLCHHFCSSPVIIMGVGVTPGALVEQWCCNHQHYLHRLLLCSLGALSVFPQHAQYLRLRLTLIQGTLVTQKFGTRVSHVYLAAPPFTAAIQSGDLTPFQASPLPALSLAVRGGEGLIAFLS
jgi:hypothetical protein